MEIPHRDLAKAQAASLVLDPHRQLNDLGTPSQDGSFPLPGFGIRWGRECHSEEGVGQPYKDPLRFAEFNFPRHLLRQGT